MPNDHGSHKLPASVQWDPGYAISDPGFVQAGFETEDVNDASFWNQLGYSQGYDTPENCDVADLDRDLKVYSYIITAMHGEFRHLYLSEGMAERLNQFWAMSSGEKRKALLLRAWWSGVGFFKMTPEANHELQHFLENANLSSKCEVRADPPGSYQSADGKVTVDKETAWRRQLGWTARVGRKKNPELAIVEWHLCSHLNLESLMEGDNVLKLLAAYAKPEISMAQHVSADAQQLQPSMAFGALTAAICRTHATYICPTSQTHHVPPKNQALQPYCMLRVVGPGGRMLPSRMRGDPHTTPVATGLRVLQAQKCTLQFLHAFALVCLRKSGVTMSRDYLEMMEKRRAIKTLTEPPPDSDLQLTAKDGMPKRLLDCEESTLGAYKRRCRIKERNPSSTTAESKYWTGRCLDPRGTLGWFPGDMMPEAGSAEFIQEQLLSDASYRNELAEFMKHCQADIRAREECHFQTLRAALHNPGIFQNGALLFLKTAPEHVGGKEKWRIAVERAVRFHFTRCEIWACLMFMWSNAINTYQKFLRENTKALLQRLDSELRAIRSFLHVALMQSREQYLELLETMADAIDVNQLASLLPEIQPLGRLHDILRDADAFKAFGYENWFIYFHGWADKLNAERFCNDPNNWLGPDDCSLKLPYDDWELDHHPVFSVIWPILAYIVEDTALIATLIRRLNGMGVTAARTEFLRLMQKKFVLSGDRSPVLAWREEHNGEDEFWASLYVDEQAVRSLGTWTLDDELRNFPMIEEEFEKYDNRVMKSRAGKTLEVQPGIRKRYRDFFLGVRKSIEKRSGPHKPRMLVHAGPSGCNWKQFWDNYASKAPSFRSGEVLGSLRLTRPFDNTGGRLSRAESVPGFSVEQRSLSSLLGEARASGHNAESSREMSRLQSEIATAANRASLAHEFESLHLFPSSGEEALGRRGRSYVVGEESGSKRRRKRTRGRSMRAADAPQVRDGDGQEDAADDDRAEVARENVAQAPDQAPGQRQQQEADNAPPHQGQPEQPAAARRHDPPPPPIELSRAHYHIAERFLVEQGALRGRHFTTFMHSAGFEQRGEGGVITWTVPENSLLAAHVIHATPRVADPRQRAENQPSRLDPPHAGGELNRHQKSNFRAMLRNRYGLDISWFCVRGEGRPVRNDGDGGDGGGDGGGGGGGGNDADDLYA